MDIAKDLDNFSYFVFRNGQMVPLSEFHEKIWPTLQLPFSNDLKEYTTHMHFTMSTTMIHLRLISFYNSLTNDAIKHTLHIVMAEE